MKPFIAAYWPFIFPFTRTSAAALFLSLHIVAGLSGSFILFFILFFLHRKFVWLLFRIIRTETGRSFDLSGKGFP